MGRSLRERIDKIFSNIEENFDESGKCRPELVTVELARDLMNAYTEKGGMFPLIRGGYSIHIFPSGTGNGESGMLTKWVGGRKKQQVSLYWDQTFPAEIARAAAEAEKEEEHGD